MSRYVTLPLSVAKLRSWLVAICVVSVAWAGIFHVVSHAQNPLPAEAIEISTTGEPGHVDYDFVEAIHCHGCMVAPLPTSDAAVSVVVVSLPYLQRNPTLIVLRQPLNDPPPPKA